MKRYAGIALVLILLAGCVSTPPRPTPPVPPLPAARADEIRALLPGGSYLQALQRIDGIQRAKVDVPDLPALSKQALDSLSKAFTDAIDGKKFEDALRLLESARTIGQQQIAGSWTDKSVLAEIATEQEKAGTPSSGSDTARVLALADPLRDGLPGGAGRSHDDGQQGSGQVPGMAMEGARVCRARIRGCGRRSLVSPHDLGDGHHPGRPWHQGGEGGRLPGQGDRQRILHRQARLYSHESPRDRERGGSEVQGVFAPVRPSFRVPAGERIPRRLSGMTRRSTWP